MSRTRRSSSATSSSEQQKRKHGGAIPVPRLGVCRTGERVAVRQEGIALPFRVFDKIQMLARSAIFRSWLPVASEKRDACSSNGAPSQSRLDGIPQSWHRDGEVAALSGRCSDRSNLVLLDKLSGPPQREIRLGAKSLVEVRAILLRVNSRGESQPGRSHDGCRYRL
jgi:hypothetical protein